MAKTRQYFRLADETVAKVCVYLAFLFGALAIVGWVMLHYAYRHDATYPDVIRQKVFILFRTLCLLAAVFFAVVGGVSVRKGRFRAFLARLLPNVLLFALTILIVITVSEVVARFLYKQKYVVFELHGIHRVSPSEEVVYDLNPNASLSFFYKDQNEQINYMVNSLGLRGKEIPEKKPDDVVRVAVLGDSVTFGVRVDQRNIYTTKLENLLNDWARETGYPKRFEVLNPSACGWNTFNEVSWLKNVGVNLKPDVVLVQFSMNDVDDPLVNIGTTIFYHLKSLPKELFPAGLDEGKSTSVFLRNADEIRLVDIASWYGMQYSKLFALSWEMYCSAAVNIKARKEKKPPAVWLSWCLEKLADPDGQESAWVRRQFRNLRSVCEENGIVCSIVIFPLSYQLNSDNETYRKAIEMVERYSSGAEVESLNLTPDFERESKTDFSPLYLRGDASHLSAEGHALTAKILGEYLKTRVPKR